jgi:predicted RNA-binding Zn ribbon-like protein
MFSAMTTRRLAQAATLANTAPGARGGRPLPERLDTATALATLLPDAGFDGPETTSATLRSVRKLRSAIAGIWQDAAAVDIDAALDGINQLLVAAGPVRVVPPTASTAAAAGPSPAPAGPTLPRTAAVLAAGHDDDPPEKTLSNSLALALAEVALAGELTRLRTCTGEDCTNAFVDLTRNRSKQFCDEANCANRAHVKAYRARRAAEAGEAGEGAEAGLEGFAATADKPNNKKYKPRKKKKPKKK